ncbi:MAG: shikimate dehydrogenase [Burkholderiales bacterium]|nr:shikimate dehydrogenase [Burkholderiales bacterium]
MDISGSTRVFLILGDPVEQVRAPEVFNQQFRKHGVDAVLVPARVAPADLPAFVKQVFKARNIDGLCLTVPHKTVIMPLLDHCDPLGRVTGAVNAARRNADGSIEGALFDGIGFTRSLAADGVAVAGARVLIIGAGGAGVAIAASLAGRGAAQVALHDKAVERTAAAVALLSAACGPAIVAAASGDPAGYDIVVNATPLGLEAGDPIPVDVPRLDAGAAVVDILMKNQPTPLLRACHARGIAAHPGFGMLAHQMPEYLEFFGFPEIAAALRADLSEVSALLAS